MIARLTGIVAEKIPTELLLDVAGVGYAVTIPVSTYDRLPAVDQRVVLHTHFAVREDAMQLYGFATLEERSLFRLLITVAGIGPKLALNVLSCLPVSTFCSAVRSGDIKTLSRVNGIGKRVAERLVVELREKVDTAVPAGGGTPSHAQLENKDTADALAALETLGYKPEQARKAIEQVSQGQTMPAASLIRKALQLLNG